MDVIETSRPEVADEAKKIAAPVQMDKKSLIASPLELCVFCVLAVYHAFLKQFSE